MKKKLGINIEDRDLDRLRRLNETNVTKKLIVRVPVPNIFSSQISDNRDQILSEMKKEMDEKLKSRFQ